MFVTFKVVSPCLESFNNGQELSIVRFVLSLCENHFSRKIRYWVSLVKIGLFSWI